MDEGSLPRYPQALALPTPNLVTRQPLPIAPITFSNGDFGGGGGGVTVKGRIFVFSALLPSATRPAGPKEKCLQDLVVELVNEWGEGGDLRRPVFQTCCLAWMAP